ncbi:hypothetical protein SCUCBS95973_003536 [Sporothrix curviconia]|uniref:Transcriptional activator n=1 Tax=Sporothrix curviconia TaxID=1260050 RepID=A0ABP0BGG0_9PEZI
MSQNGTGRAGVVKPPSNGNGMDQLASAILDDLLYNVIHDLIMKTHRDEKQARAATAAIRVETLAAEAAQDLAGATGESKPEGLHETDAALYQSGEVTLKKNPLKTTPDILCPRCHLPRLLHPTDGRGAHKPDPNVAYCKKHPYIDKPGCDIYGQMWVAPGPGRGKKKKDFDKKVSAAIHAATTGIEGTDEKGSANGTTEQRPPNVLSFPSATCSKCKRCILVSRLNNHMGSCIGNSGRNASRAAAAKISGSGSGNGNGRDSAMADHTPPSSQKGTPLPSSQGSPRKRDADDFDDDGYDESDVTGASGSQSTAKPKKKLKSSASASASQTGGSDTGTPSSSQGLSVALNKKLTLKMKNASAAGSGSGSPAAAGNMKKQKAKPSSALSFERKINDNYDDDDDDDDDDYNDDNDDRGNNDGDYVDEDSPYKQRRAGGGGRMGDDDGHDGDGGGVRNSINFKSSSSNGGGARNGTSSASLGADGKLKKPKKLLGALSAAASPPKKTTKVPLPSIPGKKVKLVNSNSVNSLSNKATPLSPPASKNGGGGGGRVRAGSESSGTMSSPRG